MIFNHPNFLNWIGQVLGIEKITRSETRLFKHIPDPEQTYTWHTDCIHAQRVAAIRFEISPTPYSGGSFLLRHKKSQELITEVNGLKFGDACLFKVSLEDFEHKISPLTGDVPRFTLVSWFYDY